jgi:hypothetical protein
VTSTVAGIFRTVDRVTGSLENTLKGLAGVWLVLKARTAAIRWGLIGGEIAGVGGEATAARAGVAGLSGELTGLAAIGPIEIPIVLAITTEIQKGLDKAKGRSFGVKDLSVASQLAGFFGSGFPGLKAVGDAIRQGIDATAPGPAAAPIQTAKTNPFAPGGSLDQAKLIKQIKARQKAIAKATAKPLTLQGIFNVDELKLANAQAVNNEKAVRSILAAESKIVQKQEDSAKKLKDRTAFAQKLAGIMDQIRGIDQQDASNAKQSADAAKQAAEAAKKRREEAAKAAKAAIEARQFRALGLDATGQPLTPGTKALRSELANVSKAIEGTFLDTTKERRVLSKIRKVLSGGLGAVAKDVRDTIKQMLDDIDQQLKDHSTGPLTKFEKASTAQLVAGLGLDPATQKALRARLAQLGPGGTIPSRGVGAFGTSINLQQPDVIARFEINLDGRKVESSVTRHQQRRRRRNPQQQRGFAGSR